MAGVAVHPQQAMLQATATQVVLEFLLHMVRQGALLLGQKEQDNAMNVIMGAADTASTS